MADRELNRFKLERISPRYIRVAFSLAPSRELTVGLITIREKLGELPEVREAVHGYRTLLLDTDLSTRQVADAVSTHLANPPAKPPAHFDIQVSYSGEDLPLVAELLNRQPDEVIEAHSSTGYHVVALGSPGFVYLSLVPEEIAIPRMDHPRRQVPAGSIGIAGRQTGIYGASRPGGWRIIGHCTELPRVRPGDSIRLVPA